MGHLITASLLIPLPGEKLLFKKLKSILIKEKNIKDNQHEQLFTELIPEEAAAINGGWGIGDIVDKVVDTATDIVEDAGSAAVAVVGGAAGATVGAVGGALGLDTDIWKGTKVGAKAGYKLGRAIL